MRQGIISLLLSLAFLSQSAVARPFICLTKDDINISNPKGYQPQGSQAFLFRTDAGGAIVDWWNGKTVKTDICAPGLKDQSDYANYNCGSFTISMDFKKQIGKLTSKPDSKTKIKQIIYCGDPPK